MKSPGRLSRTRHPVALLLPPGPKGEYDVVHVTELLPLSAGYRNMRLSNA